LELVEFEDADSASSSDMDEYESEDELGDMCSSPRKQKHKKPQLSKTSGAGKSKAKPHNAAPPASSRPQRPARTHNTAPTASSKPQRPARPSVTAKPVKLSSTKTSSSAGVKPGAATESDDIGSFLGMKEYMEAMDRELAKTTVGKSFIRVGDEV